MQLFFFILGFFLIQFSGIAIFFYLLIHLNLFELILNSLASFYRIPLNQLQLWCLSMEVARAPFLHWFLSDWATFHHLFGLCDCHDRRHQQGRRCCCCWKKIKINGQMYSFFSLLFLFVCFYIYLFIYSFVCSLVCLFVSLFVFTAIVAACLYFLVVL